MIGSKAADPNSLSSAFRTTPPARSSPLTSNSKPKILSANFRGLHTMITSHGIPLSLYRDRHSIFQRNDSHWTLAEQLAGKQSPTQLGRALNQLGIEHIPTHSRPPRGRQGNRRPLPSTRCHSAGAVPNRSAQLQDWKWSRPRTPGRPGKMQWTLAYRTLAATAPSREFQCPCDLL